jgi:hypothetical protein
MELAAPRPQPFRFDGRAIPPGSANHPVVRQLLKKGPLSEPLLRRFNDADDQAAFGYLFRETSLDVLNACLGRIRDQEVAEFLLDSMLQAAAVLASEAFAGIEQVQGSLRILQAEPPEELSRARLLYDRHVELLGQYVFALNRRLAQVEDFLSGCQFSGSGEEKRGHYGQKVRDLAGGLHFLRADLDRWVRRFVPLGRAQSEGEEGRAFLQARIATVVDDLGLRLKEIRENLEGAIFDQLVVFDPTLTRKQIFKRDLENLLDLQSFLEWLAELMRLVRLYDQERQPEMLEQVKTLLAGFRPERFPALGGIRESDQLLFTRSAGQILSYQPQSSAEREDPIHVFLLLLGDLEKGLKQRQAQSSPLEYALE